MIRTIPLNKLVASPRNVRKSGDPQADLELKADIEARGLLQNLVVTKLRKPRGSFAVEAGERRRRALLSLVEDGKLSKSHAVCCLVIEPATAQEASLAENFQRLSMNPADECVAFQQLVDHGSDPEAIARRFGLTVRFVEGRLRLAALAPIVFEALGAGDISLDVAKAYAATPDMDRQAYVFEQLGNSYSANHPDSIRRMMTQATASSSDRRARFVGEEGYLASGGRIERDLFSDDGSARWLDIDLLDRLASEKMEAKAAEIAAAEGFAFVRPTLERWVSYDQTEGLRRIAVETPSLSDDERGEVEALESEIGGLVAILEDEESASDEREEAEAKIRALDAKIDAIEAKPPVLDDSVKASVGTFLLLDEDGQPHLDASFYSEIPPEDLGATSEEAASRSITSKANSGRSAGLSQRLVDELAIQRRDILAVHVAADHVLALDLAIFLMIDPQSGYSSESSGSSLVARPPDNPIVGFKTPEAAAAVALAQATDSLDRSWTEGETKAERFDAFRSLSDAARHAWLGHAVARTLQASLNLAGGRSCAFHDHLGQLLGIDVAKWWRPTGVNYFDRVPKGTAMAALFEVGGPALAERYKTSKKVKLAQACERIFAGDFIAEVEVKEAALSWVPGVMKFGLASPSSEDDSEPSAERAEAAAPDLIDGTPVDIGQAA